MPSPYREQKLQIGLLGAGRVATQLGLGLARAGHQVVCVWSRTAASAAALAAQLPGATSNSDPDPDFRNLPLADIYLVAVADVAIPTLLAKARFPVGALVAHTAGAVSLEVFAPFPALRGGVFYPLQTFSPGRLVDWSAVPLCVEATDAASEETLLQLAHSLSRQVARVATPQRQRLHVAAVFACNFTNHLWGISQALLAEVGLPFSLLEALVRETTEKALTHPPFTVQTGPASRHDTPTLASHEAALAAQPHWQQLYKVLTASIQEQLVTAPANNVGPSQL